MEGMPLSEVSKWDLEDVYKYHQFAIMKNDHRMAQDGYSTIEHDGIKKKFGKGK